MQKGIFYLLLLLGFMGTTGYCSEEQSIGIVNPASCIQDSKYGKFEQDQLEGIKKQMSSLIESTDKELKEVSKKLEDKEYMDGLSPEADKELHAKQEALNEDLSKYHNQLYQTLNQAQYYFIQKMIVIISKAAEEIAAQKKIAMIINKDACFFYNPTLDITTSVISQMDKNYAKDEEIKKISENKEQNKEQGAVEKTLETKEAKK